MADENSNIQTPETGNADNTPKAKENRTPTIDELSLQLAKANADNARFKNSINKLTKENADLSAWKKERMTAEEQQSEEEAQAKEALQNRIKELEDYKAVNEASKRYISMGMDVDLALATAKAEVDGNMDDVMRNIKQAQDSRENALKAEWLKSRPDILSGDGGKTVSKEEFEKMSIAERSKLRREDFDTYERLIGRK